MKLVYLNPQLNPHAMHPYHPYNTSTFAASHRWPHVYMVKFRVMGSRCKVTLFVCCLVLIFWSWCRVDSVYV